MRYRIERSLVADALTRWPWLILDAHDGAVLGAFATWAEAWRSAQHRVKRRALSMAGRW